MTFLDSLRSLRTGRQSAWMQFVNDYRAGITDLYLFFEGNDDVSYYLPHLRNRWKTRGGLNHYVCGGKDGVVELIPKVTRSVDIKWRSLFFIDKDVDDYCGFPRTSHGYLFETDCYSIENYLVQAVTLSAIWTDLFRLQATDLRLTEILRTFDNSSRSFAGAMQVVMGWIIFLRRSGHAVLLNDVSIEKVIHLDEDCMSSLISGWEAHIIAASNTHVSMVDAPACKAVIAELASEDPKKYIRGKFDMWFFVAFLNRIVAAITERVAGETRTTYKLQITAKNAIDVLSPRIPAPQMLTDFLDRTLPA